jgi:hypothetical protein
VTSDIVTRLRRWVHAVDAASASDLMDDAADEIERLRLTDEERGVLLGVAEDASYRCADFTERVVRGLLERTK